MSLVDSLVEIVNIPSVTRNEAEICAWLHDRYVDRYPIQRIGNALVIGAPEPDSDFVVLYGHTDTVPVQGDWRARIEDDRIVGLGTSDMKAGLAVMMELLDNGVREEEGSLVYVFYDAEEGPADENGLEDVLDTARWLTGADLSIVLEPTDLNLELGCNGAMNADIVFRGSTAHSARPWLGENAVTKAGDWLAAMHRRKPELVDISGLEYREVFSVTKASGGIANNIIPGEFVVNLNYRFPPIYSIEEAEERLRDVARAADEVVVKDRAPSGSVDLDHPGVQRLDALIGRERLAKQGWTDVARLTSRGAVAVNYGPGIVAQAHQVGEYVPMGNMETVYSVLHEFLT